MKNIKVIGLSLALSVASGSTLAGSKSGHVVDNGHSTYNNHSSEGYVESGYGSVEHVVSTETVKHSAPVHRRPSRTYVGADFGTADLSSPDASINADSANFRAFLGYQLNQYFAIEGGVSKMHLESDKLGEVADITGIDISVLAMLPITPKFSAYAKLGYWDWVDDTPFVKNGVKYDGTTNSDMLYGIGLQYKVSPKFRVRLDATRYEGAVVKGGEIDTLNASVVYNF